MRRQTAGLLVALLGTVALFGACGGGGSGQSGRVIRVGDQAPGFTLPSAQGQHVSLSQFRGHKPALLYFSMGPG